MTHQKESVWFASIRLYTVFLVTPLAVPTQDGAERNRGESCASPRRKIFPRERFLPGQIFDGRGRERVCLSHLLLAACATQIRLGKTSFIASFPFYTPRVYKQRGGRVNFGSFKARGAKGKNPLFSRDSSVIMHRRQIMCVRNEILRAGSCIIRVDSARTVGGRVGCVKGEGGELTLLFWKLKGKLRGLHNFDEIWFGFFKNNYVNK